MKPFNLEEARQGKPLVTRDGLKARLVGERKFLSKLYPLVIENEKGFTYHCTVDGFFERTRQPNEFDVFMAPQKLEYWVNVYLLENNKATFSHNGKTYNSKEEAEKNVLFSEDVKWSTTIKIYEEEV